jgi:threonine/homoserine/homoserine lactone efflux protein
MDINNLQLFFFATLFMVLAVIIFSAYGISAAIVRRGLIERPRVNRLIDWATGSLFEFLGIRMVGTTH